MGVRREGKKASFLFGAARAPPSSRPGRGGVLYQLHNLEDVHNLRGFLGVGGKVVGDLVSDHWAEWVDTRKKGGCGGRGYTKQRALELEEQGTSLLPKRAKKEPSQWGHTGDVPAPPPPRS